MSLPDAIATLPSIARHGFDRCPGALKAFDASDGKIARIRLAGQPLRAPQLRMLGRLSRHIGEGHVWFTTRANLQLRALSDDGLTEFAHSAAEQGFLRSVAHERARNIVVSPLSPHGPTVEGDHPEHLARLLDDRLCASAELAQLGGRFLIGIDDGSGDVASLPLDLAVQAVKGRWVVRVGAAPEDVVDLADATDASQAATHLAAMLRVWVDGAHQRASTAWNIADLSEAEHRTFLSAVQHITKPSKHRLHHQPRAHAPVGPLTLRDGSVAVGAATPMGGIHVSAWDALAEHVERLDARVRVTPWHSLVVCNLPADEAEQLAVSLGDAGWIVGPESPWLRVHACSGTAYCVRALAPVREAAERTVEALNTAAHTPPRPIYWAGCERRCGHPTVPHDTLLAQASDAYRHVRHDGSRTLSVTDVSPRLSTAAAITSVCTAEDDDASR